MFVLPSRKHIIHKPPVILCAVIVGFFSMESVFITKTIPHFVMSTRMLFLGKGRRRAKHPVSWLFQTQGIFRIFYVCFL